MTVFTYSRIPAFNPNTSPVSVARSATGSVYDIGDTGFTTPLNLTLVATNTVTITLISDANGMFPDFTLVDRTSVVFKSGAQKMVLTTTTPVPGPEGPPGPASTVPGPATTDASLLTAGTVADARLPSRLSAVELSATYAQQWKANTAYTAGQPIVNPSGDTVTAKVAFTSGATYSAANWNGSVTLAAKGGKTKTDGQNVKNLRRPTLVLDRMFPTPRADHEIVYVDEVAKVAYSIGRDRRVRKATWTSHVDMAVAWGAAKAMAPDNVTWGAYLGMFKESITGHLFIDEVNQVTGVWKLLRSTDDGATFASALDMPGVNTKRFLGPQSVVQDPVTKYLYLVEYTTTVADTTADIWRSTDNGATWTVWKSMPRHNSNTNTIRHWHSARWDAVSQRVYFMAGDQNDIAGIYRVNAGGTDIEPVVLNKNIPYNTFPGVGYAARAVDIMFFPDYIAWGNDGGGGPVGQNYIYRMNRNQIGLVSPIVEQVVAIDNTGWYVQNASADGTAWLCSSSTEVGGGPNPDEATSHLYLVTDNGATVDEVSAVVMDGGEIGTASLTGFSNGGGAGKAFWLRAHNYAAVPVGNKNFSAFQFRARIAYGVVPLIKPPIADRLSYRREGRNWWGTTTGAAGGSVPTVFGHCSVPQQTKKMIVHNYGVRALTGTANSIRLEIYNATTGLVILSTTTLRDDRWVRDTDEYSTTLGFAAGDQIQFRVVEANNVDAAVATGTAFIEFGFAF